MRSSDKIVPGKGKVKNAESHTAPTKFASGDYYGVGVKNPMGKFKSKLEPKPAKDWKVKPKKLA